MSDRTVVSPGEYDFFGLKGMFSTPMGRLFMVNAMLDAGRFYDGRAVNLRFMTVWGISSTWSLSGQYTISRGTV